MLAMHVSHHYNPCMTPPEPKLGDLQQQWLEGQNTFKETYASHIIPTLPSEDELKMLIECRESVHNSSCYQEGTCFYPVSPRCPFSRSRERK